VRARTQRRFLARRPGPALGRALGATLGATLGALALATALPAMSAARAEEPDPADAVQGPPSAQGPAQAPAQAPAAGAGGAPPAPAAVPPPPEQSSGDETLIELPIAPAAPQRARPNEAKASPVEAPSASDTVPPATEMPDRLRVLFAADESRLDEAAESDLLRLAGYLKRHEAQRVVVNAHAVDDGQGQSQARRLSLSRALAVRTFLVESGVPAERIYLRPLGSAAADGPPDRVDILPLRP
jgi:outer membrane protein OmpA-like peptidoglycan-associated protein